ncbi:hypothetical protein LPB142_14840 [Rhodobacter xanthinilyticus]|uniref:Uncharacterized protein n=1 Tax=Rhodobacter xanthinilyticus TaxID=1850250 RepID=A0A1D9MFB5_9RHOB|nr:hypothetical protein [Rhodobacter xanthinilyticus]AOZ70450.1 hypothetical protein LPB142_14840 [Rhodobacter xanthinilyticus]
MTRHVIDQPRDRNDEARMRHFLDIARKEGVHPAVTELNERPVDRSARKVQEFLRIDREQQEDA